MWPLVRAHREIEQGRTPANGRARTRAAHGHPPGRRTCAAPGGVQRTPPARGEVPAARPPAPFPCRDTDPKPQSQLGATPHNIGVRVLEQNLNPEKTYFCPPASTVPSFGRPAHIVATFCWPRNFCQRSHLFTLAIALYLPTPPVWEYTKHVVADGFLRRHASIEMGDCAAV